MLSAAQLSLLYLQFRNQEAACVTNVAMHLIGRLYGSEILSVCVFERLSISVFLSYTYTALCRGVVKISAKSNKFAELLVVTATSYLEVLGVI